jgi:VWA domain containing CoxE-like protein
VELTQKWRLILGKDADPENQVPLPDSGGSKSKARGTEDDGGDQAMDWDGIDMVLNELFDKGNRKGSLGKGGMKVHTWLGKVRDLFPSDTVVFLQKEAIDRYGLKELLFEEEMLEQLTPDVDLVATLLAVKDLVPDEAKNRARKLVAALVKEVEEKLRFPLYASVRGALSRQIRVHSSNPLPLDFASTIRANLKHYQPEFKTIIPEDLIGFGRKGKKLKEVILLVDQSGSMGPSVIFSGIIGSILASMGSIQTRMIVFDTRIVDLTELLHDPVELLFGTQLGGGTDIGLALQYAEQIITKPNDTYLFLISDLYEGMSPDRLLQSVARMQDRQVKVFVLPALSDRGHPSYDQATAEQLVLMGVPVFSSSPSLFPQVLGDALEGRITVGYEIS